MITKVVTGGDLSEEEAISVMNEIMDGEATESQIAAFITGLRMKGETIEEITGCAKVMREHATSIAVKRSAVSIDRDEINIDRETIVDTCGTGGDKTNTFNISTTTAFVVAGAGVIVAKHGNRSVSSHCGSADVIEALGVKLDVAPYLIEECIDKIGIGFLYAPALHGAMKYAIGPRRQIGIRTIFNLLGPLTNPAGATAQLLGVYSPSLTEPLAHVLGNLGSRHVFVVHGLDSLDEVSITGETRISEFVKGRVRTYNVTPEQFGLKRAAIEEIRGGTVEENVQLTLEVLQGKKAATRDIVLLNAAFALLAADKAKETKEGIKLAEESIDSGKALKKLEELKEFTNK